MKNLFLLFSILVLTGCTQTSETPPVVTDTPLEKTEAPIAKSQIIKIEEWFDFGCGHCRNVHGTMKNLKAKYGDKLQVTERHFPLSAQTFVFAEASECARSQGKFSEFQDKVFTDYFGKFTVENINKIAGEISIPDTKAFATCVSSGAQKDKVTADIKAAERLGVTGTPFFQINGELNLPGAVSQKSFESLFDQLLAEE